MSEHQSHPGQRCRALIEGRTDAPLQIKGIYGQRLIAIAKYGPPSDHVVIDCTNWGLGAWHDHMAQMLRTWLLIGALALAAPLAKSEEHTSELQSLMRISYAVFCLKKKKQKTKTE